MTEANGAAGARPRAGVVPTPYESFIEREGVPMVHAYGITDLGEVPYGRWERIGAEACFVMLHLYHSEEFVCGTNHWFRGGFDGTPDFIKKDIRVEKQAQNLLGSFSNRIWETNFVADARLTRPHEISEEKHSLRYILFELAG